MAALASRSGDASVRAEAAAAAATAAAALHEEVLSLLPPGDPSLLSPALAARHRENLSRAAALRARAAAQASSSSSSSGGRVPAVPTLVQSLQANQAFHNPYILSRIAAQMQLADKGYGSNLPSALWREQNLIVPGTGINGIPAVYRDEDDYLTIRKQAEEAAAARLAGRTSIDFVPASSPPPPPSVAAFTVANNNNPAAVPSVAGPPGTTVQVGSHTVATVNPDGSITRVRVFAEQPASAAATVPAAASAPAAVAAPSSRRSKWDQSAHNPPAPGAPVALPVKRPLPGSGAEAGVAEGDKRSRQ
jgi:hypothetical protein